MTEDIDLHVSVYGEVYLSEETLLDSPNEVCLEYEGDTHTVEIGGKTIKFEVSG